ncbi:Filamentous Growth Regulator [Diaporthe australafricana]|uniref:Filamentous Growth Regulator n=1 Tax=Diaporthe australafricana TaxID=127596 RepID=A0ABR3Y6V2_9PEZI
MTASTDDGKPSPKLEAGDEKARIPEQGVLTDDLGADGSSLRDGEDILALQDLDPALNQKMHLVNNAIDEIGWTNYHWKLFGLNGFGYAVDSLVLLLQSIIAAQAFMEFGEVGYARALTIAVYVGMLTGAIFWGLSADIVGRRYAFNISMFICAVSTLIAGAMPNWGSLGLFIALVGFGAGGNLILDTTVFLEYLPSQKQWVLTFLAAWWGFGQAITGFIAWGFMDTMFTSGALVFVMSVLRITVVRLRETPKYLLGLGDDAQVVETLQFLATKYNRPISLTLEKLEACGEVRGAHSKSRFSVNEFTTHLRGLFATKAIGISTLLIWLSWTLIGLVYPLFYVFLPTYLATRGADFEETTYETWRNYALVNVSSIFGPMLAGWMCDLPLLGRRYTMVIGALMTMVFFFAYTAVRSAAQNVGFSCAIGFCLNIYYGTLYAYTPEVLSSAHRATGNGVAVACARVMGILSAVIATFADTSTPVPIYLCAALFIAMAVVSAFFPFEPYGKRSS